MTDQEEFAKFCILPVAMRDESINHVDYGSCRALPLTSACAPTLAMCLGLFLLELCWCRHVWLRVHVHGLNLHHISVTAHMTKSITQMTTIQSHT
jgi:hypothetical protein